MPSVHPSVCLSICLSHVHTFGGYFYHRTLLENPMLEVEPSSSVATGVGRNVRPQPQSGRVLGIAEIRG